VSVLQADGEVFVHRPGKSTPLARVMQQAVWVSLAEAQAFCKWAGGRVMTEEEYERAAEHTRYSDRYAAH
jgi:formylglycine-generating enzyme required for sulfatase activity